jgi:hypothetical protein
MSFMGSVLLIGSNRRRADEAHPRGNPASPCIALARHQQAAGLWLEGPIPIPAHNDAAKAAEIANSTDTALDGWIPMGVGGQVPKRTPNIFVSYRRNDSSAMAGWIHEKLFSQYGTSVFKDIDNIAIGENFRNAIGRALRHCDVMVAVIGPKWLGPKDDGTRRIDEERDWIRVEIEIASHLGIPIIPVLVERAQMPGTHQVPEGMREVTLLNALVIEPSADFQNQVRRLFDSIDRLPIDDAPIDKAKVDRPPIDEPAHLVNEPPLRSRSLVRRLLVPFEFRSSDSTSANIARSFGSFLVYCAYVVLIGAIAMTYLAFNLHI